MRFASKTPAGGAMMCHYRMVLLLGALLVGWSSVASAGDIYVVCYRGVSLRAADVRDVFIGEKGFAGAVKLAPADNGAAQAAFLEKVLKLDATKYANIWIKKSFRDGANPPPLKSSDAEALAYVTQTPGGCTYVGSVPPGGVSIVAKF